MTLKLNLNSNDGCFIHFNNKELLTKFKKEYTGKLGHNCCDGKGCLLIDIKTYQEANIIRYNFLKTFALFDNAKPTFECVICYENCISKVLLDCNHYFCFTCIETMKDYTDKCPLCRTKIK